MAFLPLTTWIRLVVWLIIGMVIYLTYGRKHSRVSAIRGGARQAIASRAVKAGGSVCSRR